MQIPYRNKESLDITAFTGVINQGYNHLTEHHARWETCFSFFNMSSACHFMEVLYLALSYSREKSAYIFSHPAQLKVPAVSSHPHIRNKVQSSPFSDGKRGLRGVYSGRTPPSRSVMTILPTDNRPLDYSLEFRQTKKLSTDMCTPAR